MPKLGPTLSVSSARALVILIMGVVISFVIATTVAQYRSTAIDHRVTEIVGNAMPSIQSLVRARSALRNELDLIQELSRTRPSDTSIFEKKISMSRKDLETMLKAYLTFPLFPKEPEIARALTESLPELDSEVQKYFLSIRSGDKHAIESSLERMLTDGLSIDQTLSRLAEFNSTQGQRLGLEISSIRMESLGIVIALDVLSIVLAILAAFKAVSIFRGSVQTLEDRATELEMFANRVAHDIKGPLSAIMMASSLSENSESNAKIQDLFQLTTRNANRMNQIVEGLLEFARSGAHPPPGNPIDLRHAANDTILAVRSEATQVGAELRVEGFEKPLMVRCPVGALNSIFGNLIRNAVKYIVDGNPSNRHITVRARTVRGFVRIEVEDTGPGIEPGTKSEIFNPYFRASTTRPGLGLGLATVKRIVEAYGGSVGVDSVLGQGSCFWFELPEAS